MRMEVEAAWNHVMTAQLHPNHVSSMSQSGESLLTDL